VARKTAPVSIAGAGGDVTPAAGVTTRLDSMPRATSIVASVAAAPTSASTYQIRRLVPTERVAFLVVFARDRLMFP
jgi:hypothetical protein